MTDFDRGMMARIYVYRKLGRKMDGGFLGSGSESLSGVFIKMILAVMAIAVMVLFGIAYGICRFLAWAYKNLPIKANIVIWSFMTVVGIVLYMILR